MKIQYKDAQITIFESALFRTTSTIVETADLILLVDPNWLPMEIDTIQIELNKRSKEKPLYLLFTHSDYDHIIAYAAFKKQATVIASQAFVDNDDKIAILEQIKTWDDENYISRKYSIEYPAIDIAIQTDRQQIRVGETTLTFYLAPGHNVDGIFTIIEPLGLWIAGDYLSNIEFPYIYHSSIEYEQTLAKTERILEEHIIKMLITGHGDYTSDMMEILKRRKESITYIHNLRETLKKENEFDFTTLMETYQFPRIMRQFHEKNILLIQKELSS